MPWPLSQAYNEAIQNPATSFSDFDLREATARTNALGLPVPCSGNFADVYELRNGNQAWAVKCFTRDIPGRRERYREISAHLRAEQLPIMVPFAYLDEGVRVAGQWYPVLKMEWVAGLTLNQFIKKHLHNPQKLQKIAEAWLQLARMLQIGRLAHGDLQHGNVLLVRGSRPGRLAVKLVDYDGMWAPALAWQRSGEVGHPAYQHPERLREGAYGPHVDRFPLLLIYTAIRALAVGGQALWDRYDNSDNLLFREQDLQNPRESALLWDLARLGDPEVRRLADCLSRAVYMPLDQTPLLESIVTGGPEVQRTAASLPPAGHVTEEANPDGQSVRRETENGRRKPWLVKNAMLLAVPSANALAVLVCCWAIGVWICGQSEDTGTLQHPSRRAQPAPPEQNRPTPDPWIPPAPRAPAPGGLPPQIRALISKRPPQVAFTPDGRHVLECRIGQDVTLWRASDRRQVQIAPGPYICAALAPDGRHAVFARSDGPAELWDLQSWQKVCHLVDRSASQPPNPALALTFSPDSKYILGTEPGHWIRVWDAETGKETRGPYGVPDNSLAVDITPDGTHWLVAAATKHEVYVLEAVKGRPVGCFRGHNKSVESVVATSDNRRVISGGLDGVRVWEIDTGNELFAFPQYGPEIAIVPGGPCLLSAAIDKTVHLWRWDTGQELRAFRNLTGPLGVSPDGHLALSGRNGSLYEWRIPDLPSQPPVAAPRGGHPQKVPDSKPKPEGHPELGPQRPNGKRPDEDVIPKRLKRVQNSIGTWFVQIPAGEFWMGSPKNEPGRQSDEEPRHRVRITKPFYLAIYPCTQREYALVMHENPSRFRDPDGPVEGIGGQGAAKFCNELSQRPEEKRAGHQYRLPTEAEWEYACRAGTTTAYNTGHSLTIKEANYNAWARRRFAKGTKGFVPNHNHTTVKVGSYPPNAWGLYDMHGNVSQMVSDWYDPDYYARSPADDPQGPDHGKWRVARGGSWASSRSDCRSARREAVHSSFLPDDTVGFRIVLEVHPAPSVGGTLGHEPPAARDPAETVMYVSDMQEYALRSAEGRFGKYGYLGYKAGAPPSDRIHVNGKESPHGLSMCPFTLSFARVKYHLPATAHTFKTRVALNDSAGADGKPPGVGRIPTPVTFQVIGDGMILWTSKPVNIAHKVQDCTVDVTGLKVLELRVNCPGSWVNAQTVWLEPRVLLK